ncbi:transcription-repair coupling factor (superfamily II helicase) [Gracilibacillus ureilyticus]|uniref:Transcription-repair-coupling factor n=1 Tax=Gracilibacillus ureilyticus TaxID=531814 RepID=A0A1H9VMJ7_9BACI|nr:transcription-repair coupling factor [Gracilibacillus ureilyticus]SES22925.1 transcription-repair coupling factor (superfamily II helicase) [Gracilibacillus ureilyticus]
MQEIKQFLRKKEDIYSIIEGVNTGLKEQVIAGLSGSARSLFSALIHEAISKKVLIVTHQLTQAQQLYEDLLEFSEGSDIYLYPVNELLASELAIASPELLAQRIESLTSWLKGDNGIMIAPVAGLKRLLPPVDYWKKYQLKFELEKILDIEETIRLLIDMGYERQEMTSSPGEFSIRGGILDIYPLTADNPLRVELFDDEIDSIRYFDAESQRSLEKLDEARIGPATELLTTDHDLITAAQRMEKALQETLKKTKSSQDKQALSEAVQGDIDRLNQCERFQDMKKYISYFYDQPTSLLNYLPDDGLIILDEMSRIQETAMHLDEEEGEWLKDNLSRNQALSDLRLSFDWHDTWANMNQPRLYLSVFLRHIPNTNPSNIVNMSTRSMQQFHGQMNLFQNEMERWKKSGYSVIVLAPNDQRVEKVHSVLEDYQINAAISEDIPSLPVDQPIVTVGSIQSGFEIPLHKIAVVTENELFKQKTMRTKRKQKISNAERIKSYQELQVGDYVVHTNHGIGRYIGIETLEVAGLHKDFMLLKYSGDDKLYVPIDQIDLVQKYVGSEGKEPKLYRLGGNDWKKVKSKVQSKVEDIADDLIKLYAEREAAKGFAFSEDTEMQRDFEAAFPYQETEDQIRCINEIKEDMEKERPMDRLLCGDVGYGKTEVAIRAAFKAIADGKQVAILVPTTILAQQHYETVMERFQDFPINVGLLSRFRTRKQQSETLKGLKNGMVDIVIGTHRLLSKDVVYKDLGLLIVDEEQRFGVKHKEKIKQLKTNVDVLTLTATPIPRTLHMSMLGVRDLSVIETPPENRFPIQTYVMEFNGPLVREAIERELARGGQVFFLYNRVESIERMAQEIQALVEDARVTFAHGQMNETELENVMFSFLEGEADVLVSTTIIETGVDIPNVNTLIVYDADRMGLSQLYQLRGRVGRSNRVAYAYFTYQKDKILTEVSEKRLQAIKEFTELGSGFKIAMRDLSIRGAGNILGSQQHGFIDSVGFDMYSQMLKEAVQAKQQGKTIEEVQPFEVELDLKVDAYIPDEYIKDEKQKIDMYKRFQAILSQEDIHDLRDELIDRFGDYPEQVENLFHVTTLKMMAKKERVESISEKKNQLELIVEEKRSQELDGAKLFEFANKHGRLIQLGTEDRKLKVVFRFDKNTAVKRYTILESFIQTLHEMDREPVV